MPPMNATGTKTAERTSAIATTGPETSSIALRVAAFGSIPCSMWCMTASTTTIASSTTMPIARTSPRSERTLTEKPRIGKTAKVAISETGTVRSGINVARQFCRKMKTTMITRRIASKRVWTISLIPSEIASVVSRDIVHFRSFGKVGSIAFIVFSTASRTASAFDPGDW